MKLISQSNCSQNPTFTASLINETGGLIKKGFADQMQSKIFSLGSPKDIVILTNDRKTMSSNSDVCVDRIRATFISEESKNRIINEGLSEYQIDSITTHSERTIRGSVQKIREGFGNAMAPIKSAVVECLEDLINKVNKVN